MSTAESGAESSIENAAADLVGLVPGRAKDGEAVVSHGTVGAAGSGHNGATSETAAAGPRRRRTRRRRRVDRQPARRFMVVTHRWTSLVLGVVLVVVSTSGAVLVYRPDLMRVLNASAYATHEAPSGQSVSRSGSVSFEQARDVVLKAHPDFDVADVVADHGVLRVTDYTSSWTVDPGTGAILGHVSQAPAWLGFLDNLHECFLSCSEEPGYLSGLNATVPGSGWLGDQGADVTWGALVLGIMGLLLLFLTVSGLWLWFPRHALRRTAFRMRWQRGRFARDTDLHKLIGFVAIPALLIWGITGAGFELAPVETAWYAVTPGTPLPDESPVSAAPTGSGGSKAGSTTDIAMSTAVAAAAALHPRLAVTAVSPPAEDDPTSAYVVWFDSGHDPYAESDYPGDVGVSVDRHTAAAHTYYGRQGEPLAQTIWNAWSYPVHSGYVVNGWWRILWCLLGLSPLVLAVTGMSTWLVRRRTRRTRRTRRVGRTGSRWGGQQTA